MSTLPNNIPKQTMCLRAHKRQKMQNSVTLLDQYSRCKLVKVDPDLCMAIQMPTEIVMQIFNELHLSDLVRCSQVCRRWLEVQEEILKKATRLTLYNPKFAWQHPDFYQLQFFAPINYSPDHTNDKYALKCTLSWNTHDSALALRKFLRTKMPNITHLYIYHAMGMHICSRALCEIFHVICHLPLESLVIALECDLSLWKHLIRGIVQHFPSTLRVLALISAKMEASQASLDCCPILSLNLLRGLSALCVDLGPSSPEVKLSDIFYQLDTMPEMRSLCFRNLNINDSFRLRFRDAFKQYPNMENNLKLIRHLTIQSDADKPQCHATVPALMPILERMPNLTHLDINFCKNFGCFFRFVNMLTSLEQLTNVRLTNSCSSLTARETVAFFDIKRYMRHKRTGLIEQLPSVRHLHLSFEHEPNLYFYQLALSSAFPNLVTLNFENIGRVYKSCKCIPRSDFDFSLTNLTNGFKCVKCPVEVAVAFAGYFRHLKSVTRNGNVVFDRVKDQIGQLAEFRQRLETHGQSVYPKRIR